MAGKIMNTKGTPNPTKTFHGAKKVVISQAPVKWVALEYANEQGEIEPPIVAVVIGGVVYIPKGAEIWSKELQPAKDWLSGQVLATMAAQEQSLKQVPADAVQILEDGDGAPAAG